MKIKAVCEATGLTDRTIRFYIEEGIISPEYTENYLGRKTFDFSQTDIDALQEIAVLRKFGFSIAEIKEILQHPENIEQIVDALRVRKQKLIEQESAFLDVLSHMDYRHTENVSALVAFLSTPVAHMPIPAQDTTMGIFDIIDNAIDKIYRFICHFVIPVCAVVGCLALVQYFWGVGQLKTTDRIEDYGKITGNFDNRTPKEFIFSFFPNIIADTFSDVTYHYASKKGDSYAFECYLEFAVSNPAEFDYILSKSFSTEESTIFSFRNDFMEYSLENIYNVDWDTYYEDEGNPIYYARIAKILYNRQEQRIIYWALGVCDGGGTGTSELSYFLNKFQIDPFDYQLNAYLNYTDQQNGITYEERYGSIRPNTAIKEK